MKTKNIYSYPIEKKYIQKIVTKAPGHIIYVDEKTGAEYDVTKAVDFWCAEGSPVKAALGGEVDCVVANKKKNYPLEELKDTLNFGEGEGNFIGIKHTNGEFSLYSHLKYKSVQVEEGQKVNTGEVIGYSGNTGLSGRPHLHFMVSRFTEKVGPGEPFESLKIRWK